MLFATSCRTPSIVDFRQTGTILASDDERANRVFSNYLDLVASRSALRGTARVLLEGPDFKLNRPQRILVERPARVRLEVIGLFDQLAAMLATDGERFGFYEVSKGQIERGRVTPTLLWDLAKIDLEVREIVGLLLASPKPDSGLARAAVWLEPAGGLVLAFAWPDSESTSHCYNDPGRALVEVACFVTIDSLENGGEIFRFDVEGKLVEMRGFDPDGVVRFRATFEDYRWLEGEAGKVAFPHRVTIHSPAADSLARFIWKRVMLADRLPDRFFMIPEPGVARQEG